MLRKQAQGFICELMIMMDSDFGQNDASNDVIFI